MTTKTARPRTLSDLCGTEVKALLATPGSYLVLAYGALEVWSPADVPAGAFDDEGVVVHAEHTDAAELLELESEDAALEVGSKISKPQLYRRVADALLARIAEAEAYSVGPLVPMQRKAPATS